MFHTPFARRIGLSFSALAVIAFVGAGARIAPAASPTLTAATKSSSVPSAKAAPRVIAALSHEAPVFEVNRGQAYRGVLYLSHGGRYSIYLSHSGAAISAPTSTRPVTPQSPQRSRPAPVLRVTFLDG